jgi:hypothetical protein
MTATVATALAALKEYYEGPIRDAFNRETLIYQYLETKKRQAGGRGVFIPFRTHGNTGIGFRGLGDTLPTAGNQGVDRLEVAFRRAYATFNLDGLLIALLDGNNQAGFVSAMDFEMDGAKSDLILMMNRAFFAGNLTKGFLSQHQVMGVTGAAQVNGNIATFDQVSGLAVDFDGDFVPFAACAPANTDTWVRVQLFRTDTYDEIVGAGGGIANANLFVCDSDQANGTLSFAYGDDAGGGATITTVGPDVNTPIAVALHPTQAVDSAGPAVPIGNLDAFAVQEIEGIVHNLAYPTHHGRGRDTAGGIAVLRSHIRRASLAVPGARAALTTLTLDQLEADIGNISGAGVPDIWWMNRRQRARYYQLAYTPGGTATAVRPGGTLDVGIGKEAAYNTTPVKVDQHVPNGCIMFMNSKTWERHAIQDIKFADKDGAVLSRDVLNRDQWGGFMYWYGNMCCVDPRANGILVGLTL